MDYIIWIGLIFQTLLLIAYIRLLLKTGYRGFLNVENYQSSPGDDSVSGKIEIIIKNFEAAGK